MILPTKRVPPGLALITVAAEVYAALRESKTVSRLWEEFRNPHRGLSLPYEWFILAVDLLFMTGAVQFTRGRLERVRR
jgi:hypothetical protein